MKDISGRLQAYLLELWEGIEKGKQKKPGGIKNEADLETYVSVGDGTYETLLLIMGYETKDVWDHTHQLQAGVVKHIPDYVLLHNGKAGIVLELKGPDETPMDGHWKQIISYLQLSRAAMGVLFNGKTAQMFINTDLSQLKAYDTNFGMKPVIQATSDDPALMGRLLTTISAGNFAKKTPVAVAKAEAKKTIIGKEREKYIATRIGDIRQNPPDYLLQAITAQDAGLCGLKPKPSVKELKRAWRPSSPSTSTPPGPVNPRLRAKVAAVCEKIGWSEDWASKIKGLKYKVGGDEEKGYTRIPKGKCQPPEGILIQGKSKAVADGLIKELDKFLMAGL